MEWNNLQDRRRRRRRRRTRQNGIFTGENSHHWHKS